MGSVRGVWEGGSWGGDGDKAVGKVVDAGAVAKLGSFDPVRLGYVIGVCRKSQSWSDAVRNLFLLSR